jgi:transposase
MTKEFVGIDVSEDKLDVFIHPSKKYKNFPNTNTGVKLLEKFLSAFEIERVVIEATGCLEELCASYLQARDYKVSIINPYQSSSFRQALGRKAKTDLIDSEVLAKFGELLNPAISIKLSDSERKLKRLSARRNQLIKMRSGEYNRLRRAKNIDEKEDIKIHIDFLSERVKNIEGKIMDLISQSKEKQHNFKLLQTIPGVGKVVAMSLIIQVPELGKLNQRQMASICGVSPLNNDSGKKNSSKAMKNSGRPQVRTALFISSLVGIQFNPLLSSYFKRLVNERKKPKKVALGACMRKLVIIANTLIKEQRAWV